MSAEEAMISFTKAQDGSESAELGNVGTLVVRLEFKQTKGKGLGATLRNRLKPADPDLVAVTYAGKMPVEACDPKNDGVAADGAVVHGGDAAGAGGEQITLALSTIARMNDDLTAFALFATCADGFSRIEGAVARIFDCTIPGTEDHLGNVRFDLTGNHTAALLGIVAKTPTGWRFTRDPQYGQGATWREFTRIATSRVPG